MIEIAHQGRSGLAARHFFGGAAHIDIHHGRARGFRHPRRFAHPMRITARQLHDMRINALPLGPQHGFMIAQHQLIRRHHFRHDHRRTEPPRNPAKADITDTRHRRDSRAAIKLEGADF